MDITLQKFNRDAMKQKADVPMARGNDVFDRFVQWLVYKPQLHAVAPFEINKGTRAGNTQQAGFPTS